MREVTREEFEQALRPMDYTMVRGRTFFGALQKTESRSQDVPKEYFMTHGSVQTDPPILTESDFSGVQINPISRYYTAHHLIKVFRCKELRPDQIQYGKMWLDGAVENGAPYGKLGIVEMGKRFWAHIWGRAYQMKDRPGSFCIELIARLARNIGLPFVPDYQTWEISPSLACLWMTLDDRWELIAVFDKGKYYLPE